MAGGPSVDPTTFIADSVCNTPRRTGAASKIFPEVPFIGTLSAFIGRYLSANGWQRTAEPNSVGEL